VIPAQKSSDLLHRKAAHEHVAKLGQLRIRPFPCSVHGRRFGVSVGALWIEHQGTNQAQERDLFGTSRAAEERTDFDIRYLDANLTSSIKLGPQGIHVAHFMIDGGVRSARRPDPNERPDSTLDPDGIAQTYVEVLRQPRNAWSLEVELRPWVETF